MLYISVHLYDYNHAVVLKSQNVFTYEILFLCNNYISVTVPSTISKVYLAITVTGMQQVLFVNWTTPQSVVPISQYHVQYRNEIPWINAFKILVGPPAVFAILSGLNADTMYSVRVRAISAVGDGNWSKVQSVRTYNCE